MRRIINTVVIVILSITSLGLLIYAFDQQVEAQHQLKIALKHIERVHKLENELAVLKSGSPIKANFSALIVNDVEVSIDWYREILGFEVVDSTISEERGLKQHNLENGASRLELIEITSAVDPPDGRVKGIFKIGYSVADFDSWVKRLESEVSLDEIVTDPVEGKRTMVLTDLEGNRIQLFEQ